MNEFNGRHAIKKKKQNEAREKATQNISWRWSGGVTERGGG